MSLYVLNLKSGKSFYPACSNAKKIKSNPLNLTNSETKT